MKKTTTKPMADEPTGGVGILDGPGPDVQSEPEVPAAADDEQAGNMPSREAIEELLDLIRAGPRSYQEVTVKNSELDSRIKGTHASEEQDRTCRTMAGQEPRAQHWVKCRADLEGQKVVFDPAARRQWGLAMIANAIAIRRTHHAMAERYHELRTLQLEGALTPTLLLELKRINSQKDAVVEAITKLGGLPGELCGPSLVPSKLFDTQQHLQRVAAGFRGCEQIPHRQIRESLRRVLSEAQRSRDDIGRRLSSDGWQELLDYEANICD